MFGGVGRAQHDELESRFTLLENTVMINLPRFATLEAKMSALEKRMLAVEMPRPQANIDVPVFGAADLQENPTAHLADDAPPYVEASEGQPAPLPSPAPPDIVAFTEGPQDPGTSIARLNLLEQAASK